MTDNQQPPKPLWAVVANMTSELRNGKEAGRQYTGTPVFSAGAKLHLGEVYWGMLDNLHVIGQGRNSRKLVNCVVDFNLLVDVRPKLIYSPSRLKSLQHLNAFLVEDSETAEAFAKRVVGIIQWLHDKPWRNVADPAELR